MSKLLIIIVLTIIVFLLLINKEHYNIEDNKFKIKKAYYINLEKRTDRKELIENMLKKTSLKNKCTRFNAVDGTVKGFKDEFIKSPDFKKYFNPKCSLTGGQIACAMSHVKLWEKIASDSTIKNNEWILILEDDAEIKPYFQKKYNKFTKSLIKNNKNPDIMPLGILGPQGKKINEDLFQLHFGWGTHAYVIKKYTCTILLSRIKINAALDDYMFNTAITKLNVIKPLKNIIIQNRDLKSDIGVGTHFKPNQLL
jgi:glycosyl transferase family 25